MTRKKAEKKKTYTLAPDTTYSGWAGDQAIEFTTGSTGKVTLEYEDEQVYVESVVAPNYEPGYEADEEGNPVTDEGPGGES